MAEHAAPQPPAPARRSRRVLIIAVAAVVVIAGAVTGIVLVTSSSPKHKAALPPAPTPTPAVTQVAPPSVVPTSTAPSVPHDVVAAAAPTSFEIKGAAFDIKAHVCGMLNIRPLDPPGEQHHTVCWVKQGFGVAPGSNSATTYVLGHAWGQDDQEVLNSLSSNAMVQVLKAKPVKISGIDTYPVTSMNGYQLTLTTPKGVLTYTVKDVYAVSKSQAGYVQPLMDQSTANRVVIITCGELKHHDYDYNIIVDAFLTSSVASPA